MISLYNIDIGQAEQRNVARVLESGQLASGSEVEGFEEEFADFCTADTAIATSNGTTALHAALHGLGIGSGDAVVTTPLSFVATANTIRLCGATPQFADVDPETYNIDPETVEAKLSADDDIEALITVNL
jgi:dTDP-4-amino-4,6-dideoxygalactose transaminase